VWEAADLDEIVGQETMVLSRPGDWEAAIGKAKIVDAARDGKTITLGINLPPAVVEQVDLDAPWACGFLLNHVERAEGEPEVVSLRVMNLWVDQSQPVAAE
jgi:hypothetical protein